MATILVIDDEPVVVELLADLLADVGHTVVSAANGADGLRRASEVRPDLIISDVMMPGLDGHAVARALAADPLLRNTPLVLMSAGPARPDALEPSVVAFLAKPFHIDHLLDLLDRLLG